MTNRDRFDAVLEKYWQCLSKQQRAEAAERRAEEAEGRVKELIAVFDSADEARYSELVEADAEADKWKSEGDMYGWNFHKGRAGGINQASIIFHRVKRAMESAIAPTTKGT